MYVQIGMINIFFLEIYMFLKHISPFNIMSIIWL